MKFKNMVILTFVIICIFISGCVTQSAVLTDSISELPTIYELFRDRFEKTKVGISYDIFKEIWPDSYLAGQNNNISAYEFRHSQLYYTTHARNKAWAGNGSIETQDFLQIIWFYFKDNKLVKFGNPEIWPSSES